MRVLLFVLILTQIPQALDFAHWNQCVTEIKSTRSHAHAVNFCAGGNRVDHYMLMLDD